MTIIERKPDSWVRNRSSRRGTPLETRLAKGGIVRQKALEQAANAPPRVEGEPEMPEWFTPDAAKVWDRFAQLLKVRGQWSIEIEAPLTALCVAYIDYARIARLVVINKHAAVATALMQADTRLRHWLVEFGLTDASRGKVTIQRGSKEDAADPLARYGLN